jgi:hypothetical protein
MAYFTIGGAAPDSVGNQRASTVIKKSGTLSKRSKENGF